MSHINNEPIKRPSKHVPQSQQKPFPFVLTATPSKDEGGTQTPAFLNGSPDTMFVGDFSLRKYLESIGMMWVLRLRELLAESDLSSANRKIQGQRSQSDSSSGVVGIDCLWDFNATVISTRA